MNKKKFVWIRNFKEKKSFKMKILKAFQTCTLNISFYDCSFDFFHLENKEDKENTYDDKKKIQKVEGKMLCKYK